MTEQWETIDVPRGAFISWGNTPGQHVTGKVVSYEPQGGTDFAGERCPQLSIELTEPAASINKEGARTDYPTGELVVLNAGQVSLKRAMQAASVNPGDLVKITLDNLAKTANGTVKEFGIKVARGAGATAPPSGGGQAPSGFGSAPAGGGFGGGAPNDEPPF